jgi:hypothetical protein
MGAGTSRPPRFPPPFPHLPSPQAIWLREGPTKRERRTLPQATSNRKLSRVEATETQQGDPLTRNRRKDRLASPWAADCVPLRIQHWVFETAIMISTRIEGRSGLGPTSPAAARDREPRSTRWQPHCIHPKLDKPGSIEERSIDARLLDRFWSQPVGSALFPEKVWVSGARIQCQKLGRFLVRLGNLAN